jgi:hypothetical protein
MLPMRWFARAIALTGSRQGSFAITNSIVMY